MEGGGWSGGRGELLESVFRDLCDTQDRNLGVRIIERKEEATLPLFVLFFHPGSQVAQVQVLGSRIGGLKGAVSAEDEKKQKLRLYAQLEYNFPVPSCKQASVRGFVAHVLSERDKPDDDVSASDMFSSSRALASDETRRKVKEWHSS